MADRRQPASRRRMAAMMVLGVGLALVLGLVGLVVLRQWSAGTVPLEPNPADVTGAWMAPLGPRNIIPDDPPLMVSVTPLDLGMVPAGEAASGTVVVANPRRRTLQIEAVRPLCGCLTILEGGSPAAIAPGGTRAITLTMVAAEEPDRAKTKKIRILSRGNDPLDVQITIRTAPGEGD